MSAALPGSSSARAAASRNAISASGVPSIPSAYAHRSYRPGLSCSNSLVRYGATSGPRETKLSIAAMALATSTSPSRSDCMYSTRMASTEARVRSRASNSSVAWSPLVTAGGSSPATGPATARTRSSKMKRICRTWGLRVGDSRLPGNGETIPPGARPPPRTGGQRPP